MNTSNNVRCKEEACINSYLEDCARIEQHQDDVKKQQSLLREIDERILADARQAQEELEDYANTRDVHLYQAMTTAQNQIYSSQTQAQQFIAQNQDDLALESRKLASEREERDKQYKKELSDLDKKSGGK